MGAISMREAFLPIYIIHCSDDWVRSKLEFQYPNYFWIYPYRYPYRRIMFCKIFDQKGDDIRCGLNITAKHVVVLNAI